MNQMKKWFLSFAVAATLLPSSLVGAATIEDIESPQIKAGKEHSIARKWDGTVWTWGNNEAGQLGNGTTTASKSPVKVNALSNMLQVAAGAQHSMALKDDGTVWAWGANEFGQLGDGTTTNRTQPAKVKKMEDAVGIEGGVSHSIAVTKDGTVWTWGKNDYNQLGPIEASVVSTPYQIPSIEKVVEVGAGLQYSVALKKDGTVWTWGYNGDGQLGDGTWYSSKGVPVQVANLDDVTAIATGNSHIVALTDNGTVWAWGRNADGQLGDGTANASNKPIRVPGMNDVVAIGAGTDYSLAVKKDGTVWGWGSNYRGQLGDTNPNEKRSPIQIGSLDGSGSKEDVVAITGGEFHTLVIKDDGSAWSLGKNQYGQLGDGTTTDTYQAVKVQRIFGNNAHLKSLQLSKGKLSPGFNRKGTEYTANVDHSVETIIITPTAYEPTASISLRVNHDPAESASSGQASSPHALAVGANEVVVSVKTEDAFKTYNITVNREADDQVPVTGIELDQNKLEMQVDSKPVLLKATITPEDATNKNVTWSSSNPKAVQVDQKGLVTPLAPGESTIRVTTEDGEKTAECLVIVKEKGSEPSVVGLEAKEESFLLKPKKSVSIKVYARYDNGTKKEITRDKKTVYESSAPSIAKIEKGVIKAGSKEGEAEITVVYQGQTQTIKVMVSKATVTKLKPSDTKMTLKPGDTNQLFVNASFTDKSDKDVTNLAKWQSSNANVVTVVAGQITAVGKGKATIKATFGGKTTVISITVKEGTTPNP